MITKFNENISIWQEFNPIELSIDKDSLHSSDPARTMAKLGFNKQRISIKDRWFDIIHPSELVRKRDKKDGYYRVVYVQLNTATGEYYIGKANRPKWSELKRYQGSGLKFKSKFSKSKEDFARYFIAVCKTAEETEALEASIVDEELLSDEYCLNLIAGGGGTTNRPTLAETREKKRQLMLNNPDQYKAMLDASKRAFQSGDSPQLRARSKRIKETISDDKYREMSRERIINWKEENPVEYAEARRKNRQKIKTPEVQAKRKESFKKWVEENPEEYKAWQEKLVKSRTSKKANDKRKKSLKEFNKNNPLAAHANAQKRAKAAAAKTSKAVSMLDLETGETLKEFPSAHAAARWLVEVGKAKNTNCVSSINGVCLKRPCTNGGYRKKAYGYGWQFTNEQKASQE